MDSPLKELFGRCRACPWGICQFKDDITIKEVRSFKRIPKGAKTIIVFLFPYYVGEREKRNISRYAMLKDYHKVAGEMLEEAARNLKIEFPFNEFAYFVDSSPIKEVKAACRAGLGCLGMNGLLINEVYGSYCFIGEIVTDLSLPFKDEGTKDCLRCGLCVKSCPGGAISEKGIDESLCLSALTQKKGELTAEEERKLKANGMVWGCDICQEVCPLCKNVPLTPFKEFKDMVVPYLTEENYEEFFPESSFAWRKKKTILRNIKIVNS